MKIGECVGLYRIVKMLDQSPASACFLAEHRFLESGPPIALDILSFEPCPAQGRDRATARYFEDEQALEALLPLPGILHSPLLFLWQEHSFVRATALPQGSRPLHEAAPGPEQSLAVLRALLTALGELHGAGVVHRDLGPHRVWLRAGDEVFVTGLDLARLTGGPRAKAREHIQAAISARYAAPELLRDPELATPSSDLFSLGLLFYELLTGRAAAYDAREVMKSGALKLDFGALTPDLRAVVERLCCVDHIARYRNAQAVLDDLRGL